MRLFSWKFVLEKLVLFFQEYLATLLLDIYSSFPLIHQKLSQNPSLETHIYFLLLNLFFDFAIQFYCKLHLNPASNIFPHKYISIKYISFISTNNWNKQNVILITQKGIHTSHNKRCVLLLASPQTPYFQNQTFNSPKSCG